MAVYRLSVDYTLADQVVGPSGKVAFVPSLKLADATGTAFGTVGNPIFVSGSSGGGAVTIADGADVAEGATSATAYSDTTGAAAGTLTGLNKGLYVLTAAMSAKLPASLGIKTAAASLSIAPASDASFATAGAAAHGAAVSGNPNLMAGYGSSTIPTATASGQATRLWTGLNGQLTVSLGARNTASSATSASAIFGYDASGNQAPLFTAGMLFDATNVIPAKSITGAVADGTGAGVTAVEQAGALFSNITTATTTTVKSGKGILHKLVFNTYVASATITIYDNTAGSGTKIGTLTLPSTITSDTPISLPYDLQFSTGLTLVTSGATDITVIYR